jgi:hypothetical protein
MTQFISKKSNIAVHVKRPDQYSNFTGTDPQDCTSNYLENFVGVSEERSRHIAHFLLLGGRIGS